MDTKRRQQEDDYVALPGGQEAHWEVVERVLFLYAKLNPGQSYVQGMNEIIGPIYYTFASDPDVRWRGESLWSRIDWTPATTVRKRRPFFLGVLAILLII